MQWLFTFKTGNSVVLSSKIKTNYMDTYFKLHLLLYDIIQYSNTAYYRSWAFPVKNIILKPAYNFQLDRIGL